MHAPISKAEIRIAIKEALANQKVKTTESEIDVMVDKTVAKMGGQKALEELLKNNYRPVANREPKFAPDSITGDPRVMFDSSHKEILKMDKKVLELEAQITELKAQRKDEITKIDAKCKSIKTSLEENQKTLTRLNVEWNAIGTLIDGIKKFFGVFTTDNQRCSECFGRRFL